MKNGYQLGLMILGIIGAVTLSGMAGISQVISQPRQRVDLVTESDGVSGVSILVRHYLEKTPAPRLEFPDLISAIRFQRQFVSALSQTEGIVIGYKAGLTNLNAQARFQVSHPLRGTLLERMVIPYQDPGLEIPANFGARPFSEGDLMVRVGSMAINEAQTPQEVLASLDAVFPFVELPDLVYAEGVPVDAPALAAVNVGARLGVKGEEIPLTASEIWQERLGNIRVEMWDEAGTLIGAGTSADLLGHPLNVVLWIKDSLVAEGESLQPGDLLSLGTITPLVPVKPKTQIRVRYLGLDPEKPIEIRLKFEE